MRMYFFIAILFFALAPANTFAQTTVCPDTAIYRTVSMGEGKTQLQIPMTFVIVKDTLNMYMGLLPDKNNLVQFKINSAECNWNKDRTSGESTYHTTLVPEGKKATILVFVGERREILIIYEYSKDPIVCLMK